MQSMLCGATVKSKVYPSSPSNSHVPESPAPNQKQQEDDGSDCNANGSTSVVGITVDQTVSSISHVVELQHGHLLSLPGKA